MKVTMEYQKDAEEKIKKNAEKYANALQEVKDEPKESKLPNRSIPIGYFIKG